MLALPLIVLLDRLADDADYTFPPDDFAPTANFFDRRFDFHYFLFLVAFRL